MQLDVRKSPSLRAAVEVMATLPRETAKQVRQHSKEVIVPEWRRGLAERSPSLTHHERLVANATTYVSDRGVRLVAGSDRADNYTRETEFGAYREYRGKYRRKSKRGGSHEVNRRVQRQFWHYQKSGHVVYPTASDMIPRIAALWVQTIVRTVHEGLEKR